MKKILALVVAMMLVLSGLACAMAEEKSIEGGFIPVLPLGVAHQYWQAVRQGAEKAAAEYGVEIVFDGPQDETMVDKQVDIMRTNLANEKLIAVTMAAIDIESVRADLEAVKAKGIPVVGFDSGLGDISDVLCSTSNYAAGELAAQHAVEILGGEGKVAVITQSLTVSDAVARTQGFVDYIEANSNIEVVAKQCGDGDQLKSADIAKAIVIGNEDLDLIYTTNEGSAVGAYNGMREIGMLGKIKIIGFDSSAALKAAVASGEIVGAITQDPIGMGYTTVKVACELALGHEVETTVDENGYTFIDTGCYWWDASNMEDENIAPLLYD